MQNDYRKKCGQQLEKITCDNIVLCFFLCHESWTIRCIKMIIGNFFHRLFCLIEPIDFHLIYLYIYPSSIIVAANILWVKTAPSCFSHGIFVGCLSIFSINRIKLNVNFVCLGYSYQCLKWLLMQRQIYSIHQDRVHCSDEIFEIYLFFL